MINDPSIAIIDKLFDGKMVGLGSGSEREIPDCQLSRFACYLIAQNGDPRKPEIANAQKYFRSSVQKSPKSH